MIETVPNNFETRSGSNNRKILDAIIDFDDFYRIDFAEEVIDILNRSPSDTGTSNKRLEEIGNIYGLGRNGLNNYEYASLISLFRGSQGSVTLTDIEGLLKLLEQIGWISDWSVSVGLNEGALLDAQRKLKGLNKLLGGTTDSGKFTPRTSSERKVSISYNLIDLTRADNIKRLLVTRRLIGIELSVNGATI